MGSFFLREINNAYYGITIRKEWFIMTRRVYLYAFDELYNIVDCRFLEGEAITVRNMKRLANWMTDGVTSLKVQVYAVDNRPGLYREFRESVKRNDFTVMFTFADTVRDEGIRLI